MDTSRVREKSSLFSIFLTFGVDQLGATIVFPIFAPLFLSPEQKLFDAAVSPSYRATMLGIFLGVFPLMQFIFSPLLGEYSDHHGRRKTLLLTTFLTFFGYALCGVGIHYHSLFFNIAAKFSIYTQVTTYPLEKADKALQDLREGKVTGSAVIITDKS